MFRIGEVIQLFHSCYLKGLSLGYDDITIEWPERIKYNYIGDDGTILRILFSCPPNDYLPMKFRESINTDEYEVIDITNPNVFFDDSPSVEHRYFDGFQMYPNEYKRITGNDPTLRVKKEKLARPRILFHHRDIHYSKYRNMPINAIVKLVKDIKNVYGDKYTYALTGDRFERIISLFDESYRPSFRNVNNAFKLVNDSFIVIGMASAINDIAGALGVKQILLNTPKKSMTGTPHSFEKERWENTMYDKFNSVWDWKDKDDYEVFYGDETINMDRIFNFIDKCENKMEIVNE
jgi:hypothetical protein